MENPPLLPAPSLEKAQRAALVNLVRRTAESEILPRFQKLTSDQKSFKSSPDDLVTEADKAAEEMLTRELNKLFPGILVVGEEAVAENPSLRGQIDEAELAFILDPIDGTWNFANDLPLFGVILSATHYGRPIFGLLYDPISDDWIEAGEDGPAEREGIKFDRQTVHASSATAEHELFGFVHFDLLPDSKKLEMASRCYRHLRKATSLHCSCHEYRLLAQGAADFHISGTLNPWDHAAGVLIVQQAGGVARMLNGDAYNTSARNGYLLVASNETAWHRLQERFRFLEES